MTLHVRVDEHTRNVKKSNTDSSKLAEQVGEKQHVVCTQWCCVKGYLMTLGVWTLTT